MVFTSQSTSTLVLALPAHAKDPESAFERWLSALWQGSKKDSSRLWRNYAPICLEYLAGGGEVSYQVHFTKQRLADISETLLPSLLPGVEITKDDGLERLLGIVGKATITTGRLRSPGSVDLSKVSPSEGVTGLLGVLESIAEGQGGLVQLMLSPTWLNDKETEQPAFWFALQIATFSGDSDASLRANVSLSSAFGQFADLNSLDFSSPRLLGRSAVKALVERRWPQRLLPPDQPATPSQVARLYHPPASGRSHHNLLIAPVTRTPAVDRMGGDLLLGEGRDSRGRNSQVRLRSEDLLRHCLVTGPTGTGKTTFLANLAGELIKAGMGITVIDPHGDLVNSIAKSMPNGHEDRACLLRLADVDHPVNLRPLRVQGGQDHLAADDFVEVLERVYGREYWGPLMDLVLRNAALAGIEMRGSILDVARIIDDPFVKRQALSRLQNQEVARFLGQFEDRGRTDRRLLPAVQRLYRLLSAPSLRNLLGQRGRGLDFGEIFDKRIIALMDLSGLGTDNSKLLGSILLMLAKQATLARAGEGTRPRHFLLIDEASWFVSRTTTELFEQARKFGVGVVLAVQALSQITPDQVRDALLSNAGSFLTFRVHDLQEASTASKRLASEMLLPSDLQHLPPFEAYIRTPNGNEPVWLRTIAPLPEREYAGGVAGRLLERGRSLYARPRSAVEAEIAADQGNPMNYEEPEIRTPKW